MAIAVYYSIEGVHAFTRPESFIYNNTKSNYETFKGMKNIVLDFNPSCHTKLKEELGGEDFPRPEIIPDPMPVDMYVPLESPHRGAGLLDPRDPSRLVNDREKIARVLNSGNDDFYTLKMKSMLPKYQPPSDPKMLKYFLDDKNRGYLSKRMLEKVGRREFAVFLEVNSAETDDLVQQFNALPNLENESLQNFFMKFGLNYWHSRGHILATSSKSMFEYVMKVTPGEKQQTAFEKALETQYLQHKYYLEVSKLLAEKGLRYYKEGYRHHKEEKFKRKHPVKFLPLSKSSAVPASTQVSGEII